MKRFWIISTLAVLAAMIFGSLLHRRGQEFSGAKAKSGASESPPRVPSFVAEAQLPVQETEMPFDSPLMPELLPEPKSDLPQVKFRSDRLAGAKEASPAPGSSAVNRDRITAVIKHVSSVDLSKDEVAEVAAVKEEEKGDAIPAGSALREGRFLPVVLHIGSEDGRLVLQGSIPTREGTDAVYAAAVKAVGEDMVDNHLKFSRDTLEADWIAYLPEYIETFFSHSAGAQELTVVDGILKLRGDVASENSMNGLVARAEALKEGGLSIESGLTVKESLAGEVTELPGTYASVADSTPESVPGAEEDLQLAMLDAVAQLRRGDDGPTRSGSIESESEPTATAETDVVSGDVVEDVASAPDDEAEPASEFLGPAVSPEKWAAGIKKAKDDLAAAEAAKLAADKAAEVAEAEKKADAEAAAIVAAEKKKAEMEAAAKKKVEEEAAALAAEEKAKAEKEAAEEAKLEAMLASGERIPDDGKPLIFYFETGSSEIVSSDREKLARAIQRAQVPRSIVYLTAYADYRGGYELNRKLSLERAEKVRSLIFAGDIADEVTAEITAKGDTQSVKQDLGKRETDEALKRSRRVVVEVYHLKR